MVKQIRDSMLTRSATAAAATANAGSPFTSQDAADHEAGSTPMTEAQLRDTSMSLMRGTTVHQLPILAPIPSLMSVIDPGLVRDGDLNHLERFAANVSLQKMAYFLHTFALTPAGYGNGCSLVMFITFCRNSP